MNYNTASRKPRFPGSKSTSELTIEKLISQPKNTGQIVLDLEDFAGFGVNPKGYSNLQEIIDLSREKIKFNQATNFPQKALSSIRYAIMDLGYHDGYACKDPSELKFCELLETRYSDCDTLLYMYLSVADELNLPLVGVLINNPNQFHTYVRWDDRFIGTSPHPMGRPRICDWEMTGNGSVKSGDNSESLTREGSLSIALYTIGSHLYIKGDLKSALPFFEKSCELNSTFEDARYFKNMTIKRLYDN